MVAQANDRERFEIESRAVEDMIDELPRLADDRTALSLNEWISWSHEWDNSMAKLQGLAELDAAGKLDSQQRHRVRAMVEGAMRVLPRVEEINWRRPAEIVLVAGRLSVSS